jgi:putative transposase
MTEELLRTLNILDEFSRECLAIRVKRKLNSRDVVDVLTDLFILRDVPLFIRSDNGPEFITDSVRNWIAAVGAKTVYIEPNQCLGFQIQITELTPSRRKAHLPRLRSAG